LGSIGVLGGMAMSAGMTYGYLRFGLILTDPNTPSLNQIAITYQHIWEAGARISVGIILLCIAWRELQLMRKSGKNDPEISG
jgi:hypothetical protein